MNAKYITFQLLSCPEMSVIFASTIHPKAEAPSSLLPNLYFLY